ncbi:hypothetical protein [Burkholderia glumae]|uniref:hypothetical protein n=1 Tax=Burkholderia glumae TaxID=337 RepID=UPI0020376289|nr:hypothetical protein [Burkholderia glumae]MCM2547541.1 hypothetical protein [Burkholderia glumae]
MPDDLKRDAAHEPAMPGPNRWRRVLVCVLGAAAACLYAVGLYLVLFVRLPAFHIGEACHLDLSQEPGKAVAIGGAIWGAARVVCTNDLVAFALPGFLSLAIGALPNFLDISFCN